MSHQLPGLTTAAKVPTTAFQLAQLNLGRAVKWNDIGVLSGPSGCGKTFALEAFLATARQVQGRQHSYLEMPVDPAPKEFNVRMLTAITGGCDPRSPNYALSDQLVEALHGSNRIVVVDEAHNLGVKGLQRLRYLHQRGEFTWTLILSGATIAQALFSADELKTRGEGLVQFSPLTGPELLATLHAFHPLLAASTNDQLRFVDAQYCHGRFRLWAKFLRICLELAPKLKATALNDKLIGVALAACGSDAWRSAKRA